MDVEKILKELKIRPDPLRDQFFLKDERLIKKIVDLAELGKSDVVLEIGAGIGNITFEIAKKAGRVITYEIDRRFKPILKSLPKNVEVHFEDAHKYVSQGGKYKHKKEYNKVVSNIPYSIGEWLLHNLTFLEYDKVVLVVAKRFAYNATRNPVFSSFFQIEQKFKVIKNKFYPVPRTDSVVIDLKKLPDPIDTKNLSLFLRQYLYQHESQKARNAFVEGLIKYKWLVYGKRLTKNEARRIIAESGIDKDLLERQPENPEIYDQVSERLMSAFDIV